MPHPAPWAVVVRLPLLIVLAVLVLARSHGPVVAQVAPARDPAAAGLVAFEDDYQDRDDATLCMVRRGDGLVAIIGDG